MITHTCAEAGRAHGHAGLDRFEDLGPTAWRQDRVGMTMHMRSPFRWLVVSANPNLAGDGLLYVTNVLGDYT